MIVRNQISWSIHGARASNELAFKLIRNKPRLFRIVSLSKCTKTGQGLGIKILGYIFMFVCLSVCLSIGLSVSQLVSQVMPSTKPQGV